MCPFFNGNHAGQFGTKEVTYLCVYQYCPAAFQVVLTNAAKKEALEPGGGGGIVDHLAPEFGHSTRLWGLRGNDTVTQRCRSLHHSIPEYRQPQSWRESEVCRHGGGNVRCFRGLDLEQCAKLGRLHTVWQWNGHDRCPGQLCGAFQCHHREHGADNCHECGRPEPKRQRTSHNQCFQHRHLPRHGQCNSGNPADLYGQRGRPQSAESALDGERTGGWRAPSGARFRRKVFTPPPPSIREWP